MRSIDERTPIVMVTYNRSTGGFLDNNPHYFRTQQSKQLCIATPSEQKLLLKILEGNKKRIASEYRPRFLQYEDDFEISFLLPIGPLSMVSIGALTSNIGCLVCGEKTNAKCSQCYSVSYCGRGTTRMAWDCVSVLTLIRLPA